METILRQFKDTYEKADYKQLQRAYEYAQKAHKGQLRLSGEPYIVHSYEVASILFDLGLDPITIIAGLLHDVVEDTSINLQDIEREFGKEVAALVDGVTKMNIIEYKSREEQQAETLRKMILAMANDIRVILIKLADRLHNMRTLKYQPQEKQKEKARETIEIFAPLAHRLGINSIQIELEDLSLKYLDAEAYFDIVSKLALTKEQRENTIENVTRIIGEKLYEVGIKAEISGRPKHIFSIYEKMKQRNKSFDEIYDLTALRLLVDSTKNCYNALGILHTIWRPIPNRFKDYIAVPKQNMYQSLHTTLLGDDGRPFEVQIRTFDMHKIAEYGIAAHWAYKEGTAPTDFDNKLSWLREIIEFEPDLKDSKEFIESLKLDFYKDEVFVFTPKGDVKDFPRGATPIDFAYSIHSAIGDKCVGAKVNGKMVPLSYQLETGDIIDIITSSALKGPSRDWLKIAHTAQAKNKIRAWFKKQAKDENILKGKELLEKEARRSGYEWHKLFRPELVKNLTKKLSINSTEDLFAAVGYGGLNAFQVINKLLDDYKKENNIEEEVIKPAPKFEKKKAISGITVDGKDNIAIRFAKCCNPVYGDNIIGYVTRGRGVSVHRADCTNLNDQDFLEGRRIPVEWSVKEKGAYNSEIELNAIDRKGLIVELASLISSLDLNLTSLNATTTKNGIANIKLTLEISDIIYLEEIIKKLRNVPSVYDVFRISRH